MESTKGYIGLGHGDVRQIGCQKLKGFRERWRRDRRDSSQGVRVCLSFFSTSLVTNFPFKLHASPPRTNSLLNQSLPLSSANSSIPLRNRAQLRHWLKICARHRYLLRGMPLFHTLKQKWGIFSRWLLWVKERHKYASPNLPKELRRRRVRVDEVEVPSIILPCSTPYIVYSYPIPNHPVTQLLFPSRLAVPVRAL